MQKNHEEKTAKLISDIKKWLHSGNRGISDYFILDKIEELIQKYEEEVHDQDDSEITSTEHAEHAEQEEQTSDTDIICTNCEHTASFAGNYTECILLHRFVDSWWWSASAPDDCPLKNAHDS